MGCLWQRNSRRPETCRFKSRYDWCLPDTKQMKKENWDLIWDKCAGKFFMDKESERVTWKEQNQLLLNETFSRNSDCLHADRIQCLPIEISIEMLATTIAEMKFNMAAGHSGIVAVIFWRYWFRVSCRVCKCHDQKLWCSIQLRRSLYP